MQYSGINCPSCGQIFNEDDDVVVCPICGTPQHRSCWKENGGCINESKHSEGFIWQNTNLPVQNNSNTGDFKICPRCGTKNSSFEPVCTNCGERLKANSQMIEDKIPYGNQPFGGYGNNVNPNNFSPYQNVYAQDAKTVYGDDAVIDDIPISEIAEYVQKDSNKYIGKFLKMQEKNTKFSWNWSAAIFSAVWCFYRKMMGCGLVLLMLFFASSTISSYTTLYIYEKQQPEIYAEYEDNITSLYNDMTNAMQNGGTIDPDVYSESLEAYVTSPISIMTAVMNLALWLVISITFGFLGNSFYKKRLIKDIHAIRNFSVDAPTYHMYLRQRGGVSIINVLIPIFCYMIVNMLSQMI